MVIDIRNFEEIRHYQDPEVNPVLLQLLDHPSFQKLARLFYPEISLQEIRMVFENIHSIREFQSKVTYPVLKRIIGTSSTEVTCEGIGNLDNNQAYLFISNHHDIVLDPSVLNMVLFEHGFKTSRIAIGDNLLSSEWIKIVARLNKSFIVHRNPSLKDSYYISQRLSNYIHYSIFAEKESVWIAQREGRAKDGNDITQVSLLKMLSFGSEDPGFMSLKKLNIVPVSISYEYDPCDILKVIELIEFEKNRAYKKTAMDDIISMSTGLTGHKGRIHLSIGKVLDDEFDGILQHETSKAQFQALAAVIDENIQSTIHLWPDNYVAYDMLMGKKLHVDKYNPDDEQHFRKYLERRLKEKQLCNEDARHKFLSIYANPTKNQLRYTVF